MERLEIIEALKHLPDAVLAETEGLSESTLRHRSAANEWSIKEIVGHLRDAAEVWHKRIYSTCSLTDPRFASFDGEAWVHERGYLEADLGTLVADMRKWRLQTVDVLARAVDWTRLGQHADMGRRSLKQWAEYMIEHEAGHLASIHALKTGQMTRQPG